MSSSYEYFVTEESYEMAHQAALDVLLTARDRRVIDVEWDWTDRDSKLSRLAWDIVSAIARSNVVDAGDIVTVSEIDYKFVD